MNGIRRIEKLIDVKARGEIYDSYLIGSELVGPIGDEV